MRTRRTSPRPLRARRAFTLLETIVAVAAVALIAVGLASIFDAVGKTVSGGRRVSLLSTYQALLENQMRRDFDAMTREGFLAIRQQWAESTPDDVFDPNDPLDRIPLTDQDLTPRARRIDEIVFFARGRFETTRPPMARGVTATADTARIYYGHGRRLRDTDPARQVPALGNPTDDLDDRLGRDAPGNPNRYAADWTLLRHATLLAEPAAADQRAMPDVFGLSGANPSDRLRMEDESRLSRTADPLTRPVQVALQPAAPSLFRRLNLLLRPGEDTLHVRLPPDDQIGPAFTSGLVDVAVTGLAAIRSFTTGSDLFSPAGSLFYRFPQGMVPADANIPPGTRFEPEVPLSAGRRLGLLDSTHAWMSNAFPAESQTESELLALYPDTPSLVKVERPGARIRYEPQPVGLLDAIGTPSGDPIQDAVKRADQLTLASSVFLPRCTNFIVEWSFGQIDAAAGVTKDQAIWFGLDRQVDSDANGTINASSASPDLFVARPYPFVGAAKVRVPHREPVRLRDGRTAYAEVPERLIYGYTPGDPAPAAPFDAACTTAYFGYTDPTFNPRGDFARADGTSFTPPVAASTRPFDAPTSAQTTTRPWPWPRLIRVTATVADPQDPTIETTFQFIFSTPPPPGA